MLRVACPECNSVNIDRINRDVVVSQFFYLEENTDYFVEGGVEKPYKYMQMLLKENEPPYIYEFANADLEFICSDCGYKFENCPTESDFIRVAKEWGLIVWDNMTEG